MGKWVVNIYVEMKTMKDLRQFIKTTIREYLNENANIITESKQVGTLYHSTTIRKLFEIINENKLKTISKNFNNLTDYRTQDDDIIFLAFLGPVLKDPKKYPPYVSFTRNKKYQRRPDDVTIVIDGNKLSERYKIRPYSHFGGREEFDEMEERVYNDVNNLDRYIINIILPFENEELESLLYKKNIPYEIR